MNGDALRLKNKKQKLGKKYASSRGTSDYARGTSDYARGTSEYARGTSDYARGTSDYANFVKCKNHLRSFTRSLRKKIEKTLASKNKTSPKPFWSYVKSKLKSRIKVPTLTKSDGTKAYNPREKADALNNFLEAFTKKS